LQIVKAYKLFREANITLATRRDKKSFRLLLSYNDDITKERQELFDKFKVEKEIVTGTNNNQYEILILSKQAIKEVKE
jgi:hypothetical protein